MMKLLIAAMARAKFEWAYDMLHLSPILEVGLPETPSYQNEVIFVLFRRLLKNPAPHKRQLHHHRMTLPIIPQRQRITR